LGNIKKKILNESQIVKSWKFKKVGKPNDWTRGGGAGEGIVPGD